MELVMIYAVLNSKSQCINRVVWDGQSEWQPPEGCTAVVDPDNLHTVYHEPQPEQQNTDPLSTLTDEQKAALAAILVDYQQT
jgi:hypothetical protein